MTVRGPRSKVPNGCAIAQRLNHHEAHEGSELTFLIFVLFVSFVVKAIPSFLVAALPRWVSAVNTISP
jgi:hypothetical protein